MIRAFVGHDEFLRTEGAREIIAREVPPESRDFGLETVNGTCGKAEETLAALDALREGLFTEGLFGGSKVVWLRDANFLPGATGKAVEAQAAKDAVAAFCEMLQTTPLPEGHTLVITAESLAKNTRFAKWLASAGTVVDCGKEVRSYRMAEAAAERLEALLPRVGLSMPPAVKTLFAGRVGNDSRTILSELEKLRTYIGESRPVTEADVLAVTGFYASAEPFDLVEALMNRNAQAVSRLVAVLRTDKDAAFPAAVAALNAFNDLCALSDAIRRGIFAGGAWNVPAERIPERLARLNGWSLKRAVQAASRYTLNELRAARHYLVEMRFRIVDSSAQGAWDIIETALLRAVSRRPPRR